MKTCEYPPIRVGQQYVNRTKRYCFTIKEVNLKENMVVLYHDSAKNVSIDFLLNLIDQRLLLLCKDSR